ncbi:MAG TPA: helix-turn-helix domain-containing protein [Hanamia sp.]|nr:helix-turn-helix domain-containing protein [Hanamia sp.]
MNQLTIEHNEVFDLAFRFVTETSENIFLTGKAGTGKTTFLKYLRDNCTKNIIVAAPTGVAAINAGGVTLHSLFHLPFSPFLPTAACKSELLSKMRFMKQRQELLRKMELLVIDEVSMVRCDVMDAIDIILRSVRHKQDLAFGGVQLLFIGDLYQLPPVAQKQEWNILNEYYSTPFFFDSRIIKEQMPVLIELKKIYRQKEDQFVSLLNKVRNNQMTPEDFEKLHSRYDPDFRPAIEEKFITLTSHNNQADLINYRELQKLKPPPFTFKAKIDGDFPESMYPAEESLLLREGAQVMFIKNDSEKRFFNGKIGVLKKLDTEEIVVDCDGEDIYVSRETWESTRYKLNKSDGKIEQERLGSFTQFPLRLAWAITIHKSQGLTFEKVMIDAGSAFSSGQVYVALSRCVSLDGIVLLSKIHPSVIFSNEHVVKGEEALLVKGSLAERFEGARKIYTQQLLESIFSFEEIEQSLKILESKIYNEKDKINADALKWKNHLKSLFTAQKEVSVKFLNYVSFQLNKEPVIEKNQDLQAKIQGAACHFQPSFVQMQEDILNHPIVTEHRETATSLNEPLNQLLLAIDLQNYYLRFCNGDFSVSSFLQHRLNYAIPRLKVTTYASGKKQAFSDFPNPGLYFSLKEWRDNVVDKKGMPIYKVANQNALKEVCTYLPFSKADLEKLSGFGKVKTEMYGEEIIQMVMDYCRSNHLDSNMKAKEIHPKRERKEKLTEEKRPTKMVSFNLFKEGKTLEEIAKERNLSVGTIEGHLVEFVANGEIYIDEIVQKEKQELIKAAIKIHGTSGTRNLKDNLPEPITYGEIRMVIAAEKKLES